MLKKIERFVKDESGATAIEYGLIAAATGVALVVTMPFIKNQLTNLFSGIGNTVQNGVNDMNQ